MSLARQLPGLAEPAAAARSRDALSSSARLVRTLVAGLILIAAVRAGLYAIYAVGAIVSPEQAFVLEGANVHLAWRAQHGLPLYPDGRQYPFTLNYMGPCYYQAVGSLGRLCGADIPRLYLIGRLLSGLSGLALAGAVAVYLAQRLGRLPALLGGLMALGAGVTVGFGVMVRPDAAADLLGLAGFLLACNPRAAAGRVISGAVLLALACLTKQTTAAYALAAIIAVLAARPRPWRNALLLLVTITLATLALLAAWVLRGERNLLAGLAGQVQIAFSRDQFITLFILLGRRSPELLWFPLLGVALWCRPEYRDRPLLILTLVLGTVALVTVGKKGSDLNYFLPLRAVAALAAATLCHAARREVICPRRSAAVLLTSFVLTLPSLLAMNEAACGEIRSACQERLPAGEARLEARQAAIAMVSDRSRPVLTDNDALAVYQGTDVPLLDALLFRLRVESGQIDPTALIRRIQRREFSALILTIDPAQQRFERYFWRLPQAVAQAVTAQYTFQRQLGRWLVYVPRPAPPEGQKKRSHG